MAFTVYILYSSSLDMYYIGQTGNMANRLVQHNAGGEKFTSRGIPWQLVWTTNKATRSEALTLEKKIKNLNRKRLQDFMTKYSEGRCCQDDS
jgi:putative endonuclease